jgi:hypothetical protein
MMNLHPFPLPFALLLPPNNILPQHSISKTACLHLPLSTLKNDMGNIVPSPSSQFLFPTIKGHLLCLQYLLSFSLFWLIPPFKLNKNLSEKAPQLQPSHTTLSPSPSLFLPQQFIFAFSSNQNAYMPLLLICPPPPLPSPF